MRYLISVLALALLSTPADAVRSPTLEPGVWTNTEDAYFAQAEGRPQPEWVGLKVDRDGTWQRVDPYGKPLGSVRGDPIPGLASRSPHGWQIGASEIRRAQMFHCWVSVRKFAAKPDGSEDWSFHSQLPAFDQGGRVLIEDAGAPGVEIRLRNVTWAKGSDNKPSLVLYVHRPGEDRAQSYSWASPDAPLIGINLRWVQASCSRDPAADV